MFSWGDQGTKGVGEDLVVHQIYNPFFLVTQPDPWPPLSWVGPFDLWPMEHSRQWSITLPGLPRNELPWSPALFALLLPARGGETSRQKELDFTSISLSTTSPTIYALDSNPCYVLWDTTLDNTINLKIYPNRIMLICGSICWLLLILKQ